MNDTSELSLTSAAPDVDIYLSEAGLDKPGRVDPDQFRKALEKVARMDEPRMEEQNAVEIPEETAHTEEEMSSNQEEVPQIQEEQDFDDDVKSKVIPRKRFDKEIEKRKELELQLQQEREEKIKFQTELDLYNKALAKLNNQTEQNHAEQDLDPIDDKAHNLYMRKINELEKKLEEQSQHTKANQAERNFENVVNNQVEQFAAGKPDFQQAYKHLVDAEMANARLLNVSESDAAVIAMQKLRGVADFALQKGQNVAEIMYNMSKNYGYSGNKVSTIRQTSPDLGKIEKNMRGSATATNDISGVTAKPGEDVGTYTELRRFEDKFMNEHGRGVNPTEFHRALEKLRAGV